MAARDIYHDLVKKTLILDGWTITHDPLSLKVAGQGFQIDLGAERVLAAEKAETKIAVEVKSFVGHSLITNFYSALGQYMVYRRALTYFEPDRLLYLAMPLTAYIHLFQTKPIGQFFLEEGNDQLRLLVFNTKTEEIVQWIP